mgnify:CR=1 FL=1
MSFRRLGGVFATLLLLPGVAIADEPEAVATFHSLGLYWTPDARAPDRSVLVRWRAEGGEWRDGLALRFNY